LKIEIVLGSSPLKATPFVALTIGLPEVGKARAASAYAFHPTGVSDLKLDNQVAWWFGLCTNRNHCETNNGADGDDERGRGNSGR